MPPKQLMGSNFHPLVYCDIDHLLITLYWNSRWQQKPRSEVSRRFLFVTCEGRFFTSSGVRTFVWTQFYFLSSTNETSTRVFVWNLPCRSQDITDFVYIDAFGKGKQLTAKECEYLIGHQVTADYYSSISTTEVLLRMVGNLLNIGKRG